MRGKATEFKGFAHGNGVMSHPCWCMCCITCCMGCCFISFARLSSLRGKSARLPCMPFVGLIWLLFLPPKKGIKGDDELFDFHERNWEIRVCEPMLFDRRAAGSATDKKKKIPVFRKPKNRGLIGAN